MSDIYLTNHDICVMFDVSRRTVQRWMKAGMPHLRFGTNLVRFREEQVKLWLVENKLISKHPQSR